MTKIMNFILKNKRAIPTISLLIISLAFFLYYIFISHALIFLLITLIPFFLAFFIFLHAISINSNKDTVRTKHVAFISIILLWIQSSIVLSIGLIQVIQGKTKGIIECIELLLLFLISIFVFFSSLSYKAEHIFEKILIIIMLLIIFIFSIIVLI